MVIIFYDQYDDVGPWCDFLHIIKDLIFPSNFVLQKIGTDPAAKRAVPIIGYIVNDRLYKV